MKRVSFLGAGSWGTALAILCANNGHKVTIWSKVQEEIDILNEHREHIYRRIPLRLKVIWKKHAQIRILSYFLWHPLMCDLQQKRQKPLLSRDRSL